MDLKLDESSVREMIGDLTNFYGTDCDITEYYLKKKHERVGETFDTDILFNDFKMSPSEMDLSIEVIDSNVFNRCTTHIATFPIESQIGRRITIGVKENNTNKYVGFIRLASPVSSIKPRNNFFGKSLQLNTVNDHIYNGQTIVPVQPFGFNYLGGKLLSLVCISNEVRELWNKNYNTNILLFETTSLYGNSKSSSMYDGLEPYIRFMDLTESKNLLFPNDEVYYKVRDLCREHYGMKEHDGMLVPKKGSSPKTREFTKVLSILKHHLTTEEKNLFNKFIKENMESKEQKRFYMSTMGFKNVKEHILNGDPLVEDNRSNYDLSNLIQYWKNKSQKRYDKLLLNNTIKTDLEVYTKPIIEQGLKFKVIR